MKKIISLILALCLCTVLLPAGASAADVVDSGNCGRDLTWTLDSNGTLTIRGTGAMTDFKDREDVPWYGSRESITAVILPEGLIRIGGHAFSGCANLGGVTKGL